MYTEARKLSIIEAVLKTSDEAVLKAIETIVEKETATSTNNNLKIKFTDALSTFTHEEAEAMKKTIEENFEMINPNDWK